MLSHIPRRVSAWQERLPSLTVPETEARQFPVSFLHSQIQRGLALLTYHIHKLQTKKIKIRKSTITPRGLCQWSYTSAYSCCYLKTFSLPYSQATTTTIKSHLSPHPVVGAGGVIYIQLSCYQRPFWPLWSHLIYRYIRAILSMRCVRLFRASGNSDHLGILTVWEFWPAGNSDHLGILTVWEFWQSGNSDRLGILTSWEFWPSGNSDRLGILTIYFLLYWVVTSLVSCALFYFTIFLYFKLSFPYLMFFPFDCIKQQFGKLEKALWTGKVERSESADIAGTTFHPLLDE